MEKFAAWQSKPPVKRPEDEVQLKNEIERFSGLAHRHVVDLAAIRRAIRKTWRVAQSLTHPPRRAGW
jgi:hypothetical protein